MSITIITKSEAGRPHLHSHYFNRREKKGNKFKQIQKTIQTDIVHVTQN